MTCPNCEVEFPTSKGFWLTYSIVAPDSREFEYKNHVCSEKCGSEYAAKHIELLGKSLMKGDFAHAS